MGKIEKRIIKFRFEFNSLALYYDDDDEAKR